MILKMILVCYCSNTLKRTLVDEFDHNPKRIRCNPEEEESMEVENVNRDVVKEDSHLASSKPAGMVLYEQKYYFKLSPIDEVRLRLVKKSVVLMCLNASDSVKYSELRKNFSLNINEFIESIKNFDLKQEHINLLADNLIESFKAEYNLI